MAPESEFEITESDPALFRANPTDSNRTTIADSTIEEWLGRLTAASGGCRPDVRPTPVDDHDGLVAHDPRVMSR
jgi:hypothetical protein